MTKRIPVYLLLGPEKGQKVDFIGEIRDTLTSDLKEKPEEYRFYAFETKINDIISLLKNGSLFSPHKLVILSGIEEVKKKDDISQLLEYCAQPSDQATLILAGDTMQVDSKLDKALSGPGKKIFWELFENQKAGWIKSFFSKQGLSIEQDATELLLEMVENDTQDIRKECEKLVAFFPKGTRIAQADIEKFIYHSKEENVFTLFEQMMTGDLTGSLDILQKIMLSKDSHPVQLLAGLLWQFRKLLALKTLTEKRYDLSEAFTKLGMRSKRHQKIYARGEKSYSLSDLRRIISLTAQYDEYARSSRTDIHSHLMQMYVYSVITRKGAPIESVEF